MSQSDIALEQNQTVKLTPKQIDIYKGLQRIGEEIAAFYFDGVKLLNSNEFQTKANLLAHLAREIDGGLRDILSQEEEKKRIQKTLTKEELGDLSEYKGHIASILAALDTQLDTPIAKRWIGIATRFVEIAHRHGAWKQPRDPSEIEKLWKEYEEVLFWLVGKYYDLINLVDRILKYEKPSEEILESLFNLLETSAISSYFFRKLQSQHWLKPLKDKGYFNPESNPESQEVPDEPGSYTIPHWSVLDYLENVANKNIKEPNAEITNSLIEIVNSIINYRDENGERIENNTTDWFILKMISTFPIEQIEEQHIEFIRIALKSKWKLMVGATEVGKTVLPKFIKHEAKDHVIKLLDVILDYQKGKGVFKDEYKSIMDDYWLYKVLKKYKPDIAKLCGLEAAEVALDKVKSISNENKSEFNNVWIPTIEDHPQKRFSDRYECQLVDFVRDIFETLDAGQITKKIEELLKEEHPIFKRIGIHTVNRHYKDLKELFWNWIDNPLNEVSVKHEIYELLKTNSLSFDEKQIEKVLEWIELENYYIPDEIKNDKEWSERVKAYYKREWLSALLKTKNQEVIERYKKYGEINPTEIEDPGLEFGIKMRWGHVSPIIPEELCTKFNIEIVEYLNSFKEERGWESPSREGLSETFRKCVSENPTKFSIDLEPFLKAHRIYQHSLLWGLWEAWRAAKTFDWDYILEFILRIIEPNGFWEESYSSPPNYCNRIIAMIADLINEGARDDNHVFSPELLPQAEKILLILADKTESDLSEMNNLVTSVLNSSKGKIFSAMINYSFRYARLYNKDTDDRWVKTIKEDFEKWLDREFEPSLEFSVVLGEYLPNLYYLNKEWVIANINKIFPKDEDIHWKATFIGYLFYSNSIYQKIYDLLRDNDHYSKALEIDFQDTNINRRLVQHICIGYIEDWEKLDDTSSLIYKLLENGKTPQLSDIVNFFWVLRDEPTDKIKSKVRPLWKVLFTILSQNVDDPEYQKVISDISKWLCLIDEIDDGALEWLKLSAKYVEINFNALFFIEYLLERAEKTPKQVGEVYLEMINAGVYPDYKQEDIQGIVQILYETGQREYADSICNMYGAKDHTFLRDLYNKYKSEHNG